MRSRWLKVGMLAMFAMLLVGSAVAYIGSKDTSNMQESVQENVVSSENIQYEQGNTCQSSALLASQNNSKKILNQSEIERLRERSKERLKIAYEKRARYWRTPDPENVKRLMKEYNSTKLVIVTDGLKKSQIAEALRVLRAAGVEVSTTTSEQLAITGLDCGVLYRGLVDVHNHDTVQWFYHDCQPPEYPSERCTSTRPPEGSSCDIHYEAFMSFDGYYTRGLIDFPGCEPAYKICGGACGWLNTLKFGSCGLTYDDLPLSVPDFTIDAYYTKSEIDGICCKCDCYTANPSGYCCTNYPQVMVTDYRGTVV